MKSHLLLFCISLLLISSQCTSQKKEEHSKTSETAIHTKNYKNKSWPQYMGPAMDGKVKSKFRPKRKPKITWEFKYEGGKPTPLVVDNGTTFFGTESKDIYAIDSIGNLKWKIKLDSKIKHSLLVSNHILVAAPDSTFVYGINAQNGKVIWKRDFSYEYKSYISDKKDMFGNAIVTDTAAYTIIKKGTNETAPLLKGDNVFITLQKHMVALDIKTGGTQYFFNANIGSGIPPLITENVIYVNDGYRNLYAHSKKNGDLKWKSKLYDLNEGKPFVYEDTLYVSSYSHLNKIDKKTGKQLGIMAFSDSEKKYDIVDNGTHYLTADGYHTHMGVNYGSYVKAFNLSSGEKIWSYNVDGKYITELIMVGDYLYFGDSTGTVYILDKTTGEKFFSGYLEGAITDPLSYANGTIYGAYEKNKHFVIFALN